MNIHIYVLIYTYIYTYTPSLFASTIHCGVSSSEPSIGLKKGAFPEDVDETDENSPGPGP